MKRLSMAIATLAGVVGCSSPQPLTESQEYYVGRTVAAQSIADYKLVEDQPLQEYVTLVGWTIAKESDRPELFFGYSFLVLDSDSINAFAAPSGFVFVTRGALKIMQNEDELAAVIAHEVAHVCRKHPEHVAQEAMKSSQWSDAIKGIGFVVSLFARNKQEAQALRDLTNLFDDVVKGINKTRDAGFGREQEMEADNFAVQYLCRDGVGYNPNALAEFLNRLPKQKGEAANGPYATHPDNEARIDAVRKQITATGAQFTTDPKRTKRFNEMTARFRQ